MREMGGTRTTGSCVAGPSQIVPGHCCGDAGGAIVEMALMLPLVMGVMLATVSSGLTLNQKLDLAHAAREGSRYGATLPSSQTFTNGGSWADNVASVARSRSNGEMNVVGANLCVALVEGSGSGGVYVVSGPFARSAYTTNTNGAPCDSAESYPTTLYDLGRRVQVRLTRPARIEMGFTGWNTTLIAAVSVKSESAG